MNQITKIDVERLHKMVMESSIITIVSHSHPDGDAIGSMIAITSFIRQFDKNVEMIVPDEIGANLFFMLNDFHPTNFEAKKESSISRIASSDLIICLDFNAFKRAGGLEEHLRESKAKKVLIDHHIGPDSASFDLVFSECAISSASEYLFWILMEMPGVENDVHKLPLEALKSLMVGMTTDTNNFANSVYPSTFKMASLLLEAGVDRDQIVSQIYNQHKENRLRAMGWMLQEEMSITDNGVAYMIITPQIMQKYNLGEGDTEGFVNLPLAIKQVRMTILLKADKTHYRVSIRSKQGISANMCARRYFNGGGHEMAAGGKLFCPDDIASLERQDAADYIERVTEEFFK